MSTLPPDPRKSPRRRVLKSALIAYNNKSTTLACCVRNFSETGAHLEFDSSLTLPIPDTFHLFVDLDGITVPCTVMWRRGHVVGVKFDEPVTKGTPTRRQVVQPRIPAAAPTLRKKPVVR